MIAAIYSRKSKFTNKGESVENQVEMCKEYLKRNHTDISDILIYEDEGFSGKDTNRPQFQKLIKDAKNKKFNIIVCYRLDRFSRNVADFSNTINLLQSYNIDFISIREQFDTSTPMGRAMMNIAAVFAQLERETIAERIKDNMLELAKTGRWLGGTAPLGYKSEPIEYSNNDGKTKKMYKLVEVPEEMEIVKLIYKLYLEKRGFNSVANYLCKNMYKGKNGGEFSRTTVEQIIKNPVYCVADKKIFNWFENKGALICGTSSKTHGLMVYNKRKDNGKKDNDIEQWIVATGKHDGIINSDVWLECQKIIEENKAKSSPRSGTGEKFLLSGMIICGECGSGMASWSHYNKKREYMERYYRCNLKNRASNRCSNKMLNTYKVEEYVVDYLMNLDLQSLKDKYLNDKNSTLLINNSKSGLAKLTKKYNDNQSIIQGLIRKMALLEDDISILELLKSEIEVLRKENDEIKGKIDIINSALEQSISKENFINDMVDKLTNFKKFYEFVDIDGKRRLLKSIVDNIVWYGENEVVEVNLIGSGKKLPQGVVKRRG